jgi:phage I-like protein/cation transport regulator ChaB
MPYGKKEELPDAVKALPEHGQEIWMAAFNSAFDQYKGDEEKCFAVAWAAVKNKFEKNEAGEWVAREEGKLAVMASLKEVPDPPGEFLLIPEGAVEIEGEPPAFLDATAAKRAIDSFERRGNDMVIDYEHQTLKDVQAPAAGWVKKLNYRAREGLYAAVEWTARAKEYLKNREYRYFSPVFWVTAKDRKIYRIENVALTNYPKINNLKPIMAKYGRFSEPLPNKEKEEAMLEKLKKLLGLATDAAEEKIAEAVQLLVNKVKDLEGKTLIACKEVLDALGAKAEAGKDEVLQVIAGLKAPVQAAVALSQKVAELERTITSMKQEDLLHLALKDGKTSPEELDKWGRDLALKSPDQFRLIVLSRPAGSVIPVGGLLPSPPAKDGLDETQKSINKMMGIDDATFAKYNKTA